jgi:microcystin-dependent protein/uncharacterized protein (DUF885 family)
MRLIIALTAFTTASLFAQPTPEKGADVSNKALITKAAPTISPSAGAGTGDIATLRKMADDYYAWRNENYPVGSSDSGLHTWDDRLTDYSAAKIAERAQHVRKLLDQVRALPAGSWPKDDRIDWMLFRSQLEGADFNTRVLQSEKTDPQIYVSECTNGIFSLLKKEYDTPRKRAVAAAARLKQVPVMLAQGERNLQKPVRLFAEFAIASARAIDPLLNDSLMTLAQDLPPNERDDLVKARDAALKEIHGFADHLEKRLPSMVAFVPMGVANYNYFLKHVLLLPLDAQQVEMLGRAELARYRALESLLPDPSLADPNPARSKDIPPDQASFLKAYESREQEMIDFMKEHHLVTIPDYLGRFEIRQLPEAFKPTSPGGFMNPPGVYDNDPTGFYFIPTYNPQSKNFYIRAAIEDPRPILGHEGIPGHFLQLSIANHLTDEIRRQNGDSVFVEAPSRLHFGVLDLRGRLPIHQGTNPKGGSTYVLAQNGGVEAVTLTVQQIPAHTHTMQGSTSTATDPNVTNNVVAEATLFNCYIAGNPATPMSSLAIGPAGGSQPHDNFQPYLCIDFIISLFGIFPHQ